MTNDNRSSMTLTQKIIARHLVDGYREIHAGELVFVKPDLALANDITGPVSIDVMHAAGFDSISKDICSVFVADHFTPNKDIKAAENTKKIKEFAFANGAYFLDSGIEHVIIPEQGFLRPGMLCVGADSHTCTYGAAGVFSAGYGSTDVAFAMCTGRFWLKVPSAVAVVFKNKLNKNICGKDIILDLIGKIGVSGASYKSIEFFGASSIPMDDRFTISNMVTEAGAKNGLFPYDKVSEKYYKKIERAVPLPNDFIWPEANNYEYPEDPSVYDQIIEIDLAKLEPKVAVPNLPENVKNVSELSDVHIDQVVIGSCTNGRISDLAAAAAVLKGHRIADGLRLIVIPGSRKVFLEAVRRGYIETFLEAGAVVSAPTCGPCLGGHMGVLASGEIALSTTNRNFTGRMGAKSSAVYLASPKTAAYSAIAGKITYGYGEDRR